MSALTKRERDKLQRMAAAFDRLDRTFLDLGRQGLQRLSRPVLDQLLAAEQVAQHAGLVKVQRELAALGTHARRYLDRDPVFRSAAWLATLNRAWELTRQAREAWSPDIHPDALGPVIGVARRRYELVERRVEVQAVGATGWVTDSDFVGLTVWLHELATGEIYQASAARPAAYFGSDPRRLLYGEISDHHAISMLDLAHGAWSLEGAKVSADGRLSMHRELRLRPGPWAGSAAYAGLRAVDWLQLVDRLILGESDLGYIEPVDVSRVVVDDTHAVASCRMTDRNGAVLRVRVRLAAHNNNLVDSLKRLTSDRAVRPDGWFGRAWVTAGELCFEPYTALFHTPVQLDLRGKREVHGFHLALEPARKLSRG